MRGVRLAVEAVKISGWRSTGRSAGTKGKNMTYQVHSSLSKPPASPSLLPVLPGWALEEVGQDIRLGIGCAWQFGCC